MRQAIDRTRASSGASGGRATSALAISTAQIAIGQSGSLASRSPSVVGWATVSATATAGGEPGSVGGRAAEIIGDGPGLALGGVTPFAHRRPLALRRDIVGG